MILPPIDEPQPRWWVKTQVDWCEEYLSRAERLVQDLIDTSLDVDILLDVRTLYAPGESSLGSDLWLMYNDMMPELIKPEVMTHEN